MALEGESLKQVAHLARLELTESEAASLRQEVSELLEYVDLLAESPASLDASCSSSNPRLSRREDKPVDGNGQELLKLSPDSKDRFVRVPRVLPS